MSLWGKSLLDAWRLFGDGKLGQEITAKNLYRWTTKIGDVVVDDGEYTFFEYLFPRALVGMWGLFDLVIALAILDCELSVDRQRTWDMLHVGAGSGRLTSAVSSWKAPLRCYSIDNDPSAITLMEARDVPCEWMDAHDMSAFADDSFPLVVISFWMISQSTDIETLIAECARVASEKVIVAGWFAKGLGHERPVKVVETMTDWQGNTEDYSTTAWHRDHVLRLFAAESMKPTVTRTFLTLDAKPDEISWLVEVGF